MTAYLLPEGKQSFQTATGAPAVGWKLYTYDTGTNNPRATWQDADQISLNANPIVMDSRGECVVFWSGSYRVRLEDNLGNTIWTIDYVSSLFADLANYIDGGKGAGLIGFGPSLTYTPNTVGSFLTSIYGRTAAEIAAGVTPTFYYYQPLNPYRYGADGTGGAADAAAYLTVNSVIAQIGTGVPTWLNGQAITGYPKTPQEIAALVTPSNYTYSADGQVIMNVFRFMTEAQIADVTSGTGSLDVSAAIQAANDYLEGKATGAIGTVNALVGGAAYNGGGSGTFFPVSLTGGAGSNASASVTVTAGVVTAVTILGPGSSFVIGNVLSITAANMVLAGAAAGGAGATVTVATLATGGKTGTATPGGKLIFPSGLYNCNLTGLRVGDMVNWEGTSISGTQLTWANAFAGDAVTLGPDESGFNGRGGFYSMGNSIERFWLKLGNNTARGVVTLGLQQNGKIKDLWVSNFNNIGVFLKDTAGSANLLCEDVYAFPGSAMSATAIGFQVDAGANCVINRCSTNGGNINLNTGIQIDGGDVKIRDFQCESTNSHIAINHGTRDGLVCVDKAVFNLSAAGSVRGLWIKTGFIGSVVAIGLDAGPTQLMIQNDVDGFQRTSGPSAGYIPYYAFVGSVDYVSNFENVVSGYKRAANININGAGLTASPVITNGMTYLINVSVGNAYTVGRPLMGPTLFPGSLQAGRRLRLQFYNGSGGVMGAVTFNAVFKMPAFVAPANGFNRTYEWEFDGAAWYECFRSAADVPN